MEGPEGQGAMPDWMPRSPWVCMEAKFCWIDRAAQDSLENQENEFPSHLHLIAS